MRQAELELATCFTFQADCFLPHAIGASRSIAITTTSHDNQSALIGDFGMSRLLVKM